MLFVFDSVKVRRFLYLQSHVQVSVSVSVLFQIIQSSIGIPMESTDAGDISTGVGFQGYPYRRYTL